MNILINCPNDKVRQGLMQAQQLGDWLDKHFDDRAKWHTCVHEAAHLLACRKLGIEPILRGPMVQYSFGRFRCQLGSVQLPGDDLLFDADPIAAAKFHISPILVVRNLTDRPDDQIVSESQWDMAGCRCWWTDRAMQNPDFQNLREGIAEDGHPVRLVFHQASEKSFHELLAATRESVLADLKDPNFRQEIMETAREYERKVFGASGESHNDK